MTSLPSREQLNSIYSRLRKLEGSTDDPVTDILFGRLRDLEERMVALEAWRWKLVGAGAAVAALISFLK